MLFNVRHLTNILPTSQLQSFVFLVRCPRPKSAAGDPLHSKIRIFQSNIRSRIDAPPIHENFKVQAQAGTFACRAAYADNYTSLHDISDLNRCLRQVGVRRLKSSAMINPNEYPLPAFRVSFILPTGIHNLIGFGRWNALSSLASKIDAFVRRAANDFAQEPIPKTVSSVISILCSTSL